MGNCWFGARWFGFRNGIWILGCTPTVESQTTNNPNQQAKPLADSGFKAFVQQRVSSKVCVWTRGRRCLVGLCWIRLWWGHDAYRSQRQKHGECHVFVFQPASIAVRILVSCLLLQPACYPCTNPYNLQIIEVDGFFKDAWSSPWNLWRWFSFKRSVFVELSWNGLNQHLKI